MKRFGLSACSLLCAAMLAASSVNAGETVVLGEDDSLTSGIPGTGLCLSKKSKRGWQILPITKHLTSACHWGSILPRCKSKDSKKIP
jgi:hypothetical protein